MCSVRFEMGILYDPAHRYANEVYIAYKLF